MHVHPIPMQWNASKPILEVISENAKFLNLCKISIFNRKKDTWGQPICISLVRIRISDADNLDPLMFYHFPNRISHKKLLFLESIVNVPESVWIILYIIGTLKNEGSDSVVKLTWIANRGVKHETNI